MNWSDNDDEIFEDNVTIYHGKSVVLTKPLYDEVGKHMITLMGILINFDVKSRPKIEVQEEEENSDDQQVDLTAAYVWPCTLLLPDFIEETLTNDNDRRSGGVKVSCMKGKRILELGAGTGILGIAMAAAFEAQVTITDMKSSLQKIYENVEANGHLWADETTSSNIVCQTNNLGCQRPLIMEHSWGRETEKLRDCHFDYIIGTDLLYFGGWDFWTEDTRMLLLKSLQAATVGVQSSKVIFIWIVRIPEREEAFLREAESIFQLRLWRGLYSKRVDLTLCNLTESKTTKRWFDITSDYVSWKQKESQKTHQQSFLVVGQPICAELWRTFDHC